MIWILRRGASTRNAARARSGGREADDPSTQSYAGAVSTYVTRICGPARAEPLTRRALVEIARAGREEMTAADAATVVSRAARAAALGELERTARQPARRAERLLAMRLRCASTPALLRARAESEISKQNLDGLYLHLNRCGHCAAIASRCDSAEWYLGTELAESRQASSRAGAGAGGYRRSRPAGVRAAEDASTPRRVEPAAGGALAHWARATDDGERTPAAPPARARREGGRPGVASAGRLRIVAAALALLVFLATGIALALGGGGHAASRRGARVAASPAPVSPAPAPAAPAPAPVPATATPTLAGVHVLRDPFVVGGARFAVFLNPHLSWTAFLGTDAGAGQRWVAVAVRVRNLTMRGFDPRVLEFRLVDQNGAAYAPEPTLGTAPAALAAPRPLAVGELVQSRLGFRIPVGAAGLRLRFRPTRRGRPILVLLGQ